jgi:uncharacterized protein YraI
MNKKNESNNAFIFLAGALVVLLVGAAVGLGIFFLNSLDKTSEKNEIIEELKTQVDELEEQVASQETKYTPKDQNNQSAVEPSVNTSHLVVAYVKDEGGYTNVRSGKGMEYSISGKYKDGTSILVHPNDLSKSWVRVYHNNGNLHGYMRGDKVVKKQSSTTPSLVYAYVKYEGGYTNVRSGEGSQYPVVGEFEDGERVLVNAADFSKSWMRVYHDNGTFYGYMSRSKIKR